MTTPTKINWPTLTPRERDALIAEHVMERKPECFLIKRGYLYRPNYAGYTANEAAAGRYPENIAKAYAERSHGEVTARLVPVPDYTTSIADAFQVVEKMRAEGVFLRITCDADLWEVNAYRDGPGQWIGGNIGKSLPEQISIISLRARGFDVVTG